MRVAVAAARRQRQRLRRRRRERRLDVPRRRADAPAGPDASCACCSRPRTASSTIVRAVEPRAHGRDHHRAVRLPACSSSRIHCTRTGRPGKARRDQRGVGARVVGAVVAVAAGAFHVDARARAPRGMRSISAIASRSGIDALRVRPDREHAVLQQRDRARRADRRVHLVRTPVGRADRRRAPARPSGAPPTIT